MKSTAITAALAILVLGGLCPCPNAVFAAEPKWQAALPAIGRDSSVWIRLVEDMQAKGMYFGAMAAANHMVAMFQDVSSKEAAYRAVIFNIDQGYPVVVRDIFIPGDLTPNSSKDSPDYAFGNSYYLYKAMLSKEVGAEQWAEYYFNKVDRDNFPKYLFFTALDAYSKGDLRVAEALINKALSKNAGDQQIAFVTRMTRTLARIYFEQGEYEKSLDVYDSFLLKLNPIVPSDWLEAAWSAYHLKRYDDALGYIFNLESRAGQSDANLEKYNIRAMIYRATCAVPSMDSLIRSFDRSFKPVLNGIKRGEPLSSFRLLRELDVPENAEYNQTRNTLAGLISESARVKDLPSQDAALAGYVYRTEIQLTQRKLAALASDALSRSASQVLNVAEQMRFLRFDIQRSKYDPDLVFKEIQGDSANVSVKKRPADGTLEIRWLQLGDFWLDERNKIKGLIPNQCTN